MTITWPTNCTDVCIYPRKWGFKLRKSVHVFTAVLFKTAQISNHWALHSNEKERTSNQTVVCSHYWALHGNEKERKSNQTVVCSPTEHYTAMKKRGQAIKPWCVHTIEHYTAMRKRTNSQTVVCSHHWTLRSNEKEKVEYKQTKWTTVQKVRLQERSHSVWSHLANMSEVMTFLETENRLGVADLPRKGRARKGNGCV